MSTCDHLPVYKTTYDLFLEIFKLTRNFSRTEQYTLENYLATGACDAARSGAWDCDPAGTALKTGGSSGFEGLLAGYRDSSGSFYNLSSGTYFWSSLESSVSYAWFRYFFSSYSTVNRYAYYKNYGFSARCIKD